MPRTSRIPRPVLKARERSARSRAYLLRVILPTAPLFASVSVLAAFVPMEWHSQKARIVGTIRDVSGAPLVNAKVLGSGTEWSLDGLSGTQKYFETRTDSLGAYQLELPAGADVAMVEHPDQHGFPERELLASGPIEPGEHRVDHQFHLFRVRGRVLGPDSLPAARGLVIYYADPGKSMICGTGLPQVSVVNGSFEVTLQHRGPYIFCTSLSESPFGAPNVAPHIQINADTLITIQVGGIPVEGSVRGYGDLPLGGATISVVSSDFADEVRADSTGRFRLSVTKGMYRWRIQPANRGFQRWTTSEPVEIAGPRRIDLAMNSVRWTGRVRDRRSGENLDSIRIYANEQGMNSWQSGADCLTGPGGEFRLFLRRGAVFDLSLSDARIARVAMPVLKGSAERLDREQRLERKHARVFRRTITGVAATSDSTFDILMEPVPR